MKKEYNLNGLSCGNCAAKIEEALKKVPGIESVTVNMINLNLIITYDENEIKDIFDVIKRIVHRYEPDVSVLEKNKNNTVETKQINYQIVFLITGAVVFAMGMIFPFDESFKFWIFLISYIILGWSVVLKAIKNILKGQVFDENFLMSIATIGAFIIGEAPEAAAVMLFYQIGEFFQELAVKRSKRSITELMDIRPDYANIEQGDVILQIDPNLVEVNDIILVKPGEKIPLDGVIVEGSSMIDTMALTGESIPRNSGVGDQVISGCINKTSVLKIRVSKKFDESTVAKIIDLVENSANNKAPTENFITTFSRYYTPIVVLLALLIAIIPPLLSGDEWSEWINRGLIFLVISCPCALVVSIPLGFFGGVGGASKKGVLVKGSNYLEALSKLDIVVFDKTGTLTKGVFKVVNVYVEESYTKNQIVELAAKAEFFSNHPIAISIKNEYDKIINKNDLKNYKDIAGYGISVNIAGKNLLVGNDKLMKENQIIYNENKDIGTIVYVAVENKFVGSITIADEVKKDSQETISDLKKFGVSNIVMLTGDNKKIADSVANELGVDTVLAQLLPTDKVKEVEKLTKTKKEGLKLAFVGDGINDAPVLARADIGIAMGGLGSDAAVEAADVVLMTDEPSKLVEAIKISRFTKRIVWQNIIFALGVKMIFLVLGAFGFATMWEAVFADVGVTLIAVVNAMRIIRKKNYN